MSTEDFKVAGGNLSSFINFAAGDPYYLDFSEGGQQGTISWSMDKVPYKPLDGGFKIWYDPDSQQQIRDQIALTVGAYHGQIVAAAHKKPE